MSENVIFYLIGNKNDLENERKISFEKGKQLANSFGISFMEISTKNNKNVTELFTSISLDILTKQNENLSFFNSSNLQHQNDLKMTNSFCLLL